MGVIEERFSQTFAKWGIRLPPEDVAARRRGKIVKAGWSIWYLFAADETGKYSDIRWISPGGCGQTCPSHRTRPPRRGSENAGSIARTRRWLHYLAL
jgi:hypothetical protein